MSADTQGDRMSDIERCWTVFIDTFGRAFDVEDGVSPHAGTSSTRTPSGSGRVGVYWRR
jgi:hypothetical protein